MTQDYYFLANRISNLEKHIEQLLEWFNEIAPEINQLRQGAEDRCPKVCV
jgi:prefoldin subunit 5